ncbi:AP2 domain-containing protein [Paucilactobacillus sp. N302-9]
MTKENQIYRGIDIKGQRFGRLVALRPVDKQSSGDILWLCNCDCGNTTVVSAYRLRHKSTRSCGCLRKDIGRKRFTNDERFVKYQGNADGLSNQNGIIFSSINISSRNRSGVIGVSKDKRTKRWLARLYYEGHYVLLKSFENYDDAVAARKAAEKKYFKRENRAI